MVKRGVKIQKKEKDEREIFYVPVEDEESTDYVENLYVGNKWVRNSHISDEIREDIFYLNNGWCFFVRRSPRFILEKGYLKGAVREGVWKKYHQKNGKLSLIIPYADGKMHGIVEHFDVKGRFVKGSLYHNGEFLAVVNQHKKLESVCDSFSSMPFMLVKGLLERYQNQR